MNLKIDFRSGIPIYLQVVDRIKEMIVDGRLKPDDQLPTVRALAQELRINFNTVARAYRIMDEARIISTQQGRGTYITEIPPPEVSERLRHEALEALTQRFITEAIRLGFSEREVSQMVRDSLKSRKETNANDSE